MTDQPFREQAKKRTRLSEVDNRYLVIDLIHRIEERDAIIHDLQQSEEAYQRGISDGRRECIEAMIVLGDHYREEARRKGSADVEEGR